MSIKVRDPAFITTSRSLTIARPTDISGVILTEATALLDSVDIDDGVRLLGVAVSGLTDVVADQLSFDDILDVSHGEASGLDEVIDVRATVDQRSGAAADAAIDEIRAKFGPTSIGPAALVGRAGLERMRVGQNQWGPDAPPEGGTYPLDEE